MLQRILTTLRLRFERLVLRASQDAFLLRWVSLSIGVLGSVVIMQACRLFRLLDEAQLLILAGHPFYMSAEDAQVTLLSSGWQFAACVGITLYFGAVLMMQRRLGRRSHICLLAAAALALPGLLCVLWHGVLYVSQPLTCIFLLWLIHVPLTAWYRHHRS